MTVIVLSKFEGYYYIHGDGRTSQDWMGIFSDESIKVHKGKDCIYGICGNCADILPLSEALKHTRDPFKLLKLLNGKEYKPLIQSTGVLVATTSHGCYSIERRPHRDPAIEADPAKRPGATIMPISLAQMPVMDGSGFISVRTLLAQKDPNEISPDVVEDAIQDSYKVNHTIGGKVSSVRLKIGKGG